MYTSKEAQFLQSLLEGVEKPKHPIMNILFSQLSKLLSLVDGNESYQETTKEILNRVKAEWDDKG